MLTIDKGIHTSRGSVSPSIRNNTALGGQSELLNSITISGLNYTNKTIDIFIKNEDILEYNGVYEGLDNKICGIKIVYEGDIYIKRIKLSGGTRPGRAGGRSA